MVVIRGSRSFHVYAGGGKRRPWSLVFARLGLVSAFAVIYLALLAYALLKGLYFTLHLPVWIVNFLIDEFLAMTLSSTALAALLTLRGRPLTLSLFGVVIGFMSLRVAKARIKVPVSMYLDQVTQTIIYIYDINIFVLLYIIPIAISQVIALVAVSRTIRRGEKTVLQH